MNNKANESSIRKFLGIVLPFGLFILTLLPYLLFHTRLPEPIATHWGIGGQPNDSTPFFVLVIINLVLVSVPAAVMVRSARREPAYKGSMSRVIPIMAFICVSAANLSWSTIFANLDIPDWTQAEIEGGVWSGMLICIVTSGLMAGLTWWLAKLIELHDQPRPALPSANLKPGDRAMWIGTARSLWSLPLMVGLMLHAIYMLTRQNYPIGLISIIVAMVCLPFISVRVLADSSGVQLTFGPLKWPKRFIPLKKIGQARAVDVIPMQHGGWGYRPSMKLGRVSIVLRGGEGLELAMEGNKRLIITVDGAEEGAGMINDFIAQS